MGSLLSGNTLGFVRRLVALGLSRTIARLDLLHAAVAGDDARFREMLNTLEEAHARIHDQHRRVRPIRSARRRAA